MEIPQILLYVFYLILIVVASLVTTAIVTLIVEFLFGKRCKHEYKLIKDGDITNLDRRGNTITVGFLKLYECEHCKKLKTEKAYVN